MNQEIKFKKGRILLGITFLIVLLLISCAFILNPETFLRNKYSSAEYIKTVGIVMTGFSVAQIISFLPLFSRSNAITLTENFLIDNSKYESLGDIKWSDISRIKRLKKKSIQIHFKKNHLAQYNSNPFKFFLRVITNWDFKSSIIITDAFLDISRDELYETFISFHENNKNTPHNKV